MTGARQILLVKTGETGPDVRAEFGDFETWFGRHAQARGFRVHVEDVRRPGASAPASPAGAIIMGSPHACYEPHDWLPRAEDFVLALLHAGTPLLGVCFGHQLLSVARGGRVERHERGWEMGTVEVTLTEEGRNDPLFGTLDATFRVQATHQDTVTVLPPETRVLARNAHDPYQALRHGEKAWSVQFHPEVTAPMVRRVIERRADRLLADGKNPDALHAAVQESGAGATILRNFLDACRG